MKYSDGRAIHSGDSVLFKNKIFGTIVAVLDTREFSEKYIPDNFGGLESGLMIEFRDGNVLFFDSVPLELRLLGRLESL